MEMGGRQPALPTAHRKASEKNNLAMFRFSEAGCHFCFILEG